MNNANVSMTVQSMRDARIVDAATVEVRKRASLPDEVEEMNTVVVKCKRCGKHIDLRVHWAFAWATYGKCRNCATRG